MLALSRALLLGLLEHFPDSNVSVQSNAHHMALFFKQPYRKNRLELCFHALVLCLRAWNCLLVREMKAFKLAKRRDIFKHPNPEGCNSCRGWDSSPFPSEVEQWEGWDNHPNLSSGWGCGCSPRGFSWPRLEPVLESKTRHLPGEPLAAGCRGSMVGPHHPQMLNT